MADSSPSSMCYARACPAMCLLGRSLSALTSLMGWVLSCIKDGISTTPHCRGYAHADGLAAPVPSPKEGDVTRSTMDAIGTRE